MSTGTIDSPAVGVFRRTLDLTVCVLALVLLAWLYAGIAVAVRLSSPGPVLFRQRRVGRNGQEFTILKFRTMVTNPGGPSVTMPGDPRVTGVGSFLRRTSLDELPQLYNVLRGQMTLVGPRPETPGLAARYPQSARWVLVHTPGITGPTQIQLRDSTAIPPGIIDPDEWYVRRLVPLRVATDLTYLSDPSPVATLRMLFRTVMYLL